MGLRSMIPEIPQCRMSGLRGFIPMEWKVIGK